VLPGAHRGDGAAPAAGSLAGRYFGRRRAEDGTIDWNRDATSIHNLVRAVAPPYPGALTTVAGAPARVLRTRVLDSSAPPEGRAVIEVRDGRLVARCGGGGTLHVLALEVGGAPCDAPSLLARHGGKPVALGTPEGGLPATYNPLLPRAPFPAKRSRCGALK
jgi:methionyl-tRNA formyltransferase